MKPILFSITAAIAVGGGGCVIYIDPSSLSAQSNPNPYASMQQSGEPSPVQPYRERRLRKLMQRRQMQPFYAVRPHAPRFYQQTARVSSWQDNEQADRQRGTGNYQAYRQPVGKFCICSEYVDHRIPAYPETLSAQQLEQYGLAEAGFKRYNRPVPGAIVLYQPGVLGADPQAGHVEIVESVDSRGVPTISSSGPSIPAIKADAGCLNVRTSKKEKLAIAQPGVSYWRL